MATMRRGVSERVDTIEENKRVLSELIRKNEFVEPSLKELNKLFKKLNSNDAKEQLKDIKFYEPAWQSKKITDRRYGPIPGIPCGSWWGIRMDCSRDRMHDPFSASVQCGPAGAVSICTSQSNDDVDFGDLLTFTGDSCAVEDQECAERLRGGVGKVEDNGSLILNYENQVPVRIIRSYNLSNEYSPKTGYRYDGLYMVVHYWIGVSPRGDNRCYKFALKRLCHQEPPPWKSKAVNDCAESPTASKRRSKYSEKRINSNRDMKTPRIVLSARKRRPLRMSEANSDSEKDQSTLSARIPTPQASPGPKIVSNDHRNIHVSAIVTRRVSKKLLSNDINVGNKLQPLCAGLKSWSSVGGSKSQQLFNEGEEDAVKSQNTRLQNTNISIRTDLYDSSHNLKQSVKKCGSSVTHAAGIYKPRILGLPRRELNFAGVDSSPGSSRVVSSVKMEKINKPAEIQRVERFSDSISSQDKNKPINFSSDTKSSTTISTACPFQIDETYSKNKDLGDFGNESMNRIEHSYASHPQKVISENLIKPSDESESNKLCEDSTEISLPAVISPSQSPLFRGFGSPELAKSGTSPAINYKSQSPCFRGFGYPEQSLSMENLCSDTSMIFESMTFEKMLDIINEEKSSPLAKMLISNVIGLQNVASTSASDNQIKYPEPRGTCDTEKANPSSANSINAEISSAQLDREDLRISRTIKSRQFENSRQQKIIEIVYSGKESNPIRESELNEENRATDLPARKRGEVASATNATSGFGIAAKARKSIKEYKSSDENTECEISVDHESSRKEKDVFLRLEIGANIDKGRPPHERSGDQDAVHSCRDERAESRLTMTTRGGGKARSWKRHDPTIEREKLLEIDPPNLSKPATSLNIDERPKAQHPPARIITRSKCLKNLENLEQLDASWSLNIVPNSGKPEWDQNLKDPDGEEASGEKEAPSSSEEVLETGEKNDSETILDRESKKSEQQPKANASLPKVKSTEKIRLIKRPGVRARQKMEVANLFIDMNMSPRSQMSKSKPGSRRSLRGLNHLRRRSCPAVVDHGLKRRNNDPVKHPSSPLKRRKTGIKVKNSSVQISNTATAKRGLSLRRKNKSGASPASNNNNNNNNSKNNNNINADSRKRIEKAERAMNKMIKPMKTNSRKIVVQKNGRATSEITKRRETTAITRGGINSRGIAVGGRLGVRRALISSAENYGRKKRKKKEKQKQKVVEAKGKKEKLSNAKQSNNKINEFRQFSIAKAKIDSNLLKGDGKLDKPKMVSVMTQCSIIPLPSLSSAFILTGYHSSSNLSRRTLRSSHHSDARSGCLCSSHSSGQGDMKNEDIELIEIKSETLDDDVATFDEEDDDPQEIQTRINTDFSFDRTPIANENQTPHTSLRIRRKSRTSLFQRLFQSLNASANADTRRGFVPYVPRRRSSAFVPVKSIEADSRTAQLKSIGFKPIKPGLFTADGVGDCLEKGKIDNSDSPVIAYSSAVAKREVHEEYNKYTSEENNVVQYMDSNLCFEDIENEDTISSGCRESALSDLFVDRIEFVKLGSEVEEESDDESILRERFEAEEEEEEEEEDEIDAEELEREDVKEWQSQLDEEDTSGSGNNGEAIVDSDGDVPWHGWRKITSDKKTYFVGW